MSKRKIAIYSGEIPSTTFIERLIKGLSENDCSVFLFGYQKKKTDYSGKNIVVKSYSDNRFKKLFILLKYSFLLFIFKNSKKKILDDHISKTSKNKALSKLKYYPVLWYQPDVFHLQWAKSVSGWTWVQDFGIKLIVSLRGAHINYSPIADKKIAETYKQIFPKIDGFHAVSGAIKNEAQKYGANPEKINVVYSGLPENHFSETEKPKNQVFQILSIGRNHWKKGYHYALDAVKILQEQGIQIKYTIIGGKDSEELEFQKADLGLENVVELTGNIPFLEVQKMMCNSDLVLLPSVEEGIANVVLEAMQIGTLVLSTDCGGMNEVIEDKKNGFIVPIRNPQKMAQAVAEIMTLSENEKQKIISEAKKTIEKNHTETKMVSDMIALYNKLLCT